MDHLDESLPLPVDFDLLPSFVGEGEEGGDSRVMARALVASQQGHLPITCTSIRSTGLARVELDREPIQ